MIECSLNDYGSHNNNASQTIGEMIEADYLLRYLINRTKENPNLHIIVAADHETGGLTIPGDLSKDGEYESHKSLVKELNVQLTFSAEDKR